MSYDGLVTMAVAEELSRELKLGKIEKIYQPQPEQLLLSIHTKGGRRLLFLSASGNHPAAYLVSEMTENPATPPAFCMAMRKHLSAARIVEITQHDNDRILHVDLETMDEMGFSVNRRLIMEIMGKHSNIILIDMSTSRIIDCIKHISMDTSRYRQLLPGIEYTQPPSQDKIPFTQVTENHIEMLIKSEQQPERDLLKGIQGISPVVAQCLAESADPCHMLRDMIDSISRGTNTPTVYRDEMGKPVDFHAVPIPIYESTETLRPMRFEMISQACEYFYKHRESSNILKQRSGEIQRIVSGISDKLKLKLQRLNEDMRKAEDSDRYRLFGELLTANLHLVKPGSEKVTVESYYDGSQVEIPLDPRFSPSRNAQMYYKKYAKAKTAVKEKAHQIAETEKEIDYLESVSAFLDSAGSLEEVDLIRAELVESGFIRYRRSAKNRSKKNPKPTPHRYTLSSGLTVLAGRNNHENDWLSMKRAASTDLWFHTKDIPGSHVILLLDGKAPSDADLFEAASIAAYHSKGRSSSNVPVDYTLIRHVKKPSGARPGMVIFTHNKTLYVDPSIPEDQ